MSGAILQLGSGAAGSNSFLDPQGATFFRSVMRAHRNFALETMKLDFQPEARFGFSSGCIVPRHGDILAGAVLELKVKKLANSGYYYPVEALVREAQLVVGGTIVEKIPCDWLRVYDSCHRTTDEAVAYRKMTNFDINAAPGVAYPNNFRAPTENLYLPLPFTFCRRWGSALPIVALKDTEVKIVVQLADAADAGVDTDTLEMKLYATYGYLDTAERMDLVSRDQDILIEQVQTETFELPDGVPSATGLSQFSARLNFTKLVKGLYFVVKNTAAAGQTQDGYQSSAHGRYTGDAGNYCTLFGVDTQGSWVVYGADPGGTLINGLSVSSERLAPVKEARLLLGGQERMVTMSGKYFNAVHPTTQGARRSLPAGVYMYAFGLDNGQVDSTGVANFSAVDDVRLQLTFKKSVTTPAHEIVDEDEAKNIDECTKLLVFAWGYNVLRVSNARTQLLWG